MRCFFSGSGSAAAAGVPPTWGFSLPGVYLIWVGVVLTLYLLCRWFAGVTVRHDAWWLKYL